MCNLDGSLDFRDDKFNQNWWTCHSKWQGNTFWFPASFLLERDKKHYLDLCGILFKVCLGGAMLCLITDPTNTHGDMAKPKADTGTAKHCVLWSVWRLWRQPRVCAISGSADPDSPQHTIRTLCMKPRLWNEDNKFRGWQTVVERNPGRYSSPGICIVLLSKISYIINTFKSEIGKF